MLIGHVRDHTRFFLKANLTLCINNICARKSCITKSLYTSSTMSHSKYEYVRGYEEDRKITPNNWIVVRVDGKAFHNFSDVHGFEKPNDKRALDLMNLCAKRVMANFPDLMMAYGQSDEYSFVFKKDCQMYSRRAFKLTSNIVSQFASTYVFEWPNFFPDTPLKYPPAFDSRAVPYPTNRDLRNYLSWRQADCHINNLHNTTFWALVQKGGLTTKQSDDRLKGTVSSQKNEILFSEFGINYNNEPQQFRKGSVIYKKKVEIPVESGEEEKEEGITEQNGEDVSKYRWEGSQDGQRRNDDRRAKYARPDTKVRQRIFEEACDIIGDTFWEANPHLLGPYSES